MKISLFPNHVTILSYSSTSLHTFLPRFQNFFYNCHFHRPLKTWLLQFSLLQPPYFSVNPYPTNLNSLACAVVQAPKYCHIILILRSLHWLKITEHIEYKLLSLTYKVLTTNKPPYMHHVITVQLPRNTHSSSLSVCQPNSDYCLSISIHGWQVSASTGLNLGLNRPGRNRFLPDGRNGFLPEFLNQFLSKIVVIYTHLLIYVFP